MRRRKLPSFIAVDGEGTHEGARYTLLAASTGASVEEWRLGLSSKQCLDFLLDLPRPKGAVIVGFGLGYDITHWLRDLPRTLLKRIGAEERTMFRLAADTYWVRYVQGKRLEIGRCDVGKDGRSRARKGSGRVIYDCLGFFQESFLGALSEWGIGTPAEREFVRRWKARREQFTALDAPALRRYNALECRLLVALMDALAQTLADADLLPRAWHGAGAVASAILRKREVALHLGEREPREEVLRAYYGGRVQACRIGQFRGPVWNYDLNSAYPAEIAELPTRRGTWKRCRRYDPALPWALWEVRWRMEHGPAYPLTPFGWRTPAGEIRYLRRGRGIYWAPLVQVAVTGWPGEIEVLRGWVWQPENDSKPFAWVRELYDLRRAYKETGDPRHRVLKLAYNALYGKVAQGVGWQGEPPPWQDFVWAGLVTAGTQARMLAAALQKPRAVIAFATDGLWMRSPLALATGAGLGEWEETPMRDLTLYQPGVYRALTPAGEEIARSRGFGRAEIDWPTLAEEWYAHGYAGGATLSVRRMIGLRLAVKWDKWAWLGTFQPLLRRLALHADGDLLPDETLHEAPDNYAWGTALGPEDDLPRPYQPKRATLAQAKAFDDGALDEYLLLEGMMD